MVRATASIAAVVTLLATIPASPTRAWASAPEQESPGQRAARHFAAEEWDEAIEALIEAYAIDPDPDYLYARAQAERFRGRCEVAIGLYRRFLASDPSPQQRDDTLRNIELCEAQTREPPVSPPVSTVSPPPPRPTAADTTSRPPTDVRPLQPARHDVAGATLVTVGAVVTAAGASLWIAGASIRARAPDAAREADYARAADRGRALTGAGIGLGSAGLVALVAGIVRYAVMIRRARRSSSSAKRARTATAP